MSTVLVTDASGYVGSAIHHQLTAEKDLKVVGTCCSSVKEGLIPLDIQNRKSVEEVVSHYRPDISIHTTAEVDICDKDPELAWRLNVDGTANIAAVAKQVGSHLIYTSTGAVFDGMLGTFSETDKPSAQSAYGRTKLAGEQAIHNVAINSLILRLSLVIGFSPSNLEGRYFGKLAHALESGTPF